MRTVRGAGPRGRLRERFCGDVSALLSLETGSTGTFDRWRVRSPDDSRSVGRGRLRSGRGGPGIASDSPRDRKAMATRP